LELRGRGRGSTIIREHAKRQASKRKAYGVKPTEIIERALGTRDRDVFP